MRTPGGERAGLPRHTHLPHPLARHNHLARPAACTKGPCGSPAVQVQQLLTRLLARRTRPPGHCAIRAAAAVAAPMPGDTIRASPYEPGLYFVGGTVGTNQWQVGRGPATRVNGRTPVCKLRSAGPATTCAQPLGRRSVVARRRCTAAGPNQVAAHSRHSAAPVALCVCRWARDTAWRGCWAMEAFPPSAWHSTIRRARRWGAPAGAGFSGFSLWWGVVVAMSERVMWVECRVRWVECPVRWVECPVRWLHPAHAAPACPQPSGAVPRRQPLQ